MRVDSKCLTWRNTRRNQAYSSPRREANVKIGRNNRRAPERHAARACASGTNRTRSRQRTRAERRRRHSAATQGGQHQRQDRRQHKAAVSNTGNPQPHTVRTKNRNMHEQCTHMTFTHGRQRTVQAFSRATQLRRSSRPNSGRPPAASQAEPYAEDDEDEVSLADTLERIEEQATQIRPNAMTTIAGNVTIIKPKATVQLRRDRESMITTSNSTDSKKSMTSAQKTRAIQDATPTSRIQAKVTIESKRGAPATTRGSQEKPSSNAKSGDRTTDKRRVPRRSGSEGAGGWSRMEQDTWEEEEARKAGA